MTTPEDRLRRLGITLPEASAPAANYANFALAGGLLFISGKGPAGHPRGKLGAELTTEEGYRFARTAGIEALAAAKAAIGRLDRVKRVVKVQGFVNASPDFEEPHLVLNGCSDLMIDAFGPNGAHARSVLGAASLRSQLPVIVDCIFEVEN
ncbi:MAG: RidA family protein [Paenibacillaceae bacterium]|nr:RidA family protein [Paenibacillaceae bacterium]